MGKALAAHENEEAGIAPDDHGHADERVIVVYSVEETGGKRADYLPRGLERGSQSQDCRVLALHFPIIPIKLFQRVDCVNAPYFFKVLHVFSIDCPNPVPDH